MNWRTEDQAEEYFDRHRQSWADAESYWLRNPLRHVVDVGDEIVEKVRAYLKEARDEKETTVLDMGFGSAWLLDYLLGTADYQGKFVGLDVHSGFVEAANSKYHAIAERTTFEQIDFERRSKRQFQADIVVNAFNLFEILSLDTAMENAYQWTRPGGRLIVATIDVFFLILAVSSSWQDLQENLRWYHSTRGVKWTFQKIDLGDDGLSADLEYPSVLHSRSDIVDSALKAGYTYQRMSEVSYTHRTVPKVYVFFEFMRSS